MNRGAISTIVVVLKTAYRTGPVAEMKRKVEMAGSMSSEKNIVRIRPY